MHQKRNSQDEAYDLKEGRHEKIYLYIHITEVQKKLKHKRIALDTFH